MDKQYGVTWATPDHSVAQTGYVFTYFQAIGVAHRQPDSVEEFVDSMCEHYPTRETPLYGRVETADEAYDEFLITA